MSCRAQPVERGGRAMIEPLAFVGIGVYVGWMGTSSK